ncbi:MAG: transporter substrate-binding domain-containing protein [Clostridia bacterium]|nr:transporter substrate-binding domain-containing protein [Clostridia bacterium]
MKKRFLSLITIILAMVMCVFGLVGCGKDDLKGFDIDLAEAVFDELDIEVEFKLIDWNMKDAEINAGTIDLIWNGMTITEERLNNLEISKPYLTNNQVMVVKADSTLTKASITASTKIVAENGSAGFDEAKKAFPGSTVTPAKNQITCLTEVKAGTSDVAVLDSTLAGFYINNDESSFKGALKIITNSQGQYDTLSSEVYGIAAKKGYVGLMAKVNDTLAQLYADGTMKEIAKVYGLDQLLVSSSWSNYTNTFDSLSDAEKASWNNIVSKEKIVIGYTLFAPIAYK